MRGQTPVRSLCWTTAQCLVPFSITVPVSHSIPIPVILFILIPFPALGLDLSPALIYSPGFTFNSDPSPWWCYCTNFNEAGDAPQKYNFKHVFLKIVYGIKRADTNTLRSIAPKTYAVTRRRRRLVRDGRFRTTGPVKLCKAGERRELLSVRTKATALRRPATVRMGRARSAFASQTNAVRNNKYDNTRRETTDIGIEWINNNTATRRMLATVQSRKPQHGQSNPMSWHVIIVKLWSNVRGKLKRYCRVLAH
ncbi:hypothetical protein EVAR_76692_1 [Eumeta japonica]|uniref:Uncharacterized protein n=1 Tax=Eumeta variegata TaxID=151549 RepID=A0A4C1STG0_EUMVA|nr:hypothetical protein EVAR_76692_1 [Eumeta japonica]